MAYIKKKILSEDGGKTGEFDIMLELAPRGLGDMGVEEKREI